MAVNPPENPQPEVAPPQPAGTAVLLVLKTLYRNYIAAGGTTVIYGPVPVPPANTVAPAVSGTAAVGQVLTCTTGTWNGTPTGYTYQWMRDATPIAGANASTYTTVAADSGHAIGCVVTARNQWGAVAAPLSNTRAIP
jgi:hypothetical protein